MVIELLLAAILLVLMGGLVIIGSFLARISASLDLIRSYLREHHDKDWWNRP